MHKKNSPLISIIIPTFNREKIIGRAIRSILAQGYYNIEIIIIDDCSNDNTKKVVESVDDQRIIFKRLAKNSGVSAARNAGIEIASGELIAFLDSDDEWLGDMLKNQIIAFNNHPECNAAVTGFIRYYGKTPEYIAPPAGILNKDELLTAILRGNFITPQTLMIRKKCIKELSGFDTNLSHREDWDFGVRLLENNNIAVVDLPLAVVYETQDNLTSMEPEKTSTLEIFLNKHKKIFESNPVSYAYQLYFIGHSHMLTGNKNEGISSLRRSFRIHPTVKVAIALLLSQLGTNIYKFTRNLVAKN